VTSGDFSAVERVSIPLGDDIQSVAAKREETLLIGSKPFHIPRRIDLGNPLVALDAVLSGIRVQRFVRGRTLLVGLWRFTARRLQVSSQADCEG